MDRYKEGQGLLVRRASLVLLSALIVWGGITIYDWCQSFDWLGKSYRMTENPLPVINQYIDPAFFLCWIVVGVGVFFTHSFLNKPRQADFLIDVNDEIRKISWPNSTDAFNSSLVVLVFVVVMTFYILGCDFALTQLLKLIL